MATVTSATVFSELNGSNHLRSSSILTLAPVRQRALRESIFETLLSAIVRGEIKPGIWSNNKQLAEHLQISVTPLREALQDLASCGIVENQFNRGTIVRSFGPAQLAEIFHVRALLESEATRLACPQIDRAVLTKLRSQTADLMSKESSDWTDRVMKSDDDIHMLIASSCGNQRLKEEILRYRSLMMCIRRAIAAHNFPFKLALPEHLAIIDALLHQQPEVAAKAMTNHIFNAAKIDSDLLFSEAK
jgi:GntR family transcriptional regulator, rspAB operon transcriptional repressor